MHITVYNVNKHQKFKTRLKSKQLQEHFKKGEKNLLPALISPVYLRCPLELLPGVSN